MASQAGNKEDEFGLQIAPLLDVLFVLLLFFMVNAGLQQNEGELDDVPTHGGGAPVTSITLGIDSDGAIRWENAPIAPQGDLHLHELKERLRRLADNHGDLPVVIVPQPAAKHQRVVDVLSACHQADIINVSFGSAY